MNSNATSIEILCEKAKDYSKTSVELFKLNAIDKSADVISSLATRLVVFIVVAMLVLTINIGVALWLSELLGKIYYGFFVIGGCYAVIAVLLHTFRHQWIKAPVSNAIITQLLQQKTV